MKFAKQQLVMEEVKRVNTARTGVQKNSELTKLQKYMPRWCSNAIIFFYASDIQISHEQRQPIMSDFHE